MKIIAVIVTFNRLPLLKLVIESVVGQTRKVDEVLVVDNASSDGTGEYLSELSQEHRQIATLRLPENTGGAGGFHAGVKEAYARGADWVWLLDDDATPTPSALSALIDSGVFAHFTQGGEKTLGFLASRVDWTDGSVCHMNVPNVHKKWLELHRLFPGCARIVSASFVSVLINRVAIKRVGYPIKEFFIWFDDVEYTRRISGTENMVAYYVSDSVVVHRTETNLEPLDMRLIDRTNLWKYRYGVRNEIAATIRGGHGFPKAVYYFMRMSAELFRNRKYVYFFPVLAAAVRGVFFDYKKLIEFPAK